MNLAVMFYKDIDLNDPLTRKYVDPTDDFIVNGCPGIWPGPTIELGKGTTLPPGPWHLMTDVELEIYKIQNKPTLDAWKQPIDLARAQEQAQVENAVTNIDTAQTVLHQLHIFCEGLDPATAATLVTDLVGYVALLNIGLFKHAAVLISTLKDSQGILDKAADPSDPKSPTLRVFLQQIL